MAVYFSFYMYFFSMIIGIKNCVERIIKYMMMLLFIVMISVATCASRQGAVPKVMTATLNVVVSINSTTVMQTYWTAPTCECFCQPLSSFPYFYNNFQKNSNLGLNKKTMASNSEMPSLFYTPVSFKVEMIISFRFQELDICPYNLLSF